MKLKASSALDTLLRQHNLDVSLKTKKEIWKVKGLKERVGDYQGTPKQINIFVNSLKHNPEAFTDIMSRFKQGLPRFIAEQEATRIGELERFQKEAVSLSAPAPQTIETKPVGTQVPTALEKQIQTTLAKGREVLKTGAEILRGRGVEPKFQVPAPEIPSEAPPTPAPTIPPPTPAPTEMKATDVLKTLGISEIPSEKEITEKVMESPEFKLLQERLGLKTTATEAMAEAAKQTLEVKYAGEKNRLEQNLAESGLAFSGIRTSQVAALANELTASKLDIDRKLAASLLDTNLDLREAIMKSAADVIKDAQAGRKESIEQLNKVGMAVVGNQIVPTMETKREARMIETEEARREAQDAKRELDQAKFELQQAKSQSQIELAEARLDLAREKYEASKGKDFDIETYARDVFDKRIGLSSVPKEIRTMVSQRVTALEKTERKWTDEEIRSFIRTQTGYSRQQIIDVVNLDDSMTDPDKKRVLLIVGEMMPEKEKKGFGQWFLGK